MTAKTVAAAEFKATCLRLIEEMNEDGQPITITKRGKPVAVLTPFRETKDLQPLWGFMEGTVSRYDDPFGPAVDPGEWDAYK
ncbi:type II toxin-antitoxin system Phd/YefM family antitoxin [Neorhizobium alkalisoli]|uniref:type II toxin-antitoxin system Phd/YefM family antitoxin n=1 Tax=Neorhizobium alkalisoli TaxID=528178 RepID=UPI000CF86063|nr:type II toxin-antitoxin system Phd/YefM family antitoxin [Neorhizobium alkalisoli]